MEAFDAFAVSPIEPLDERPSMEAEVERALRELIVSGQLREGTPLVQRDLAERLRVSQTPVRAALTALERYGFVEVGPTGRSLVRRLTREDFEEISAARVGLEGLAARVSAPLVGDPELARMRALLEELRSVAAPQTVERYLELRWQYFSTCYSTSGRRRLVNEVERLFRRSERYNRILLGTPERFKESLRRYPVFLSACESRDGERAERAVQSSLRWAMDRVASALPAEVPSAARQ